MNKDLECTHYIYQTIQEDWAIGVDINAGYDEVFRVFKENQYSRIPVYQNSLDEIVGVLHLKDLVLFDNSNCQ